jgi:NADH-quinone oxidoreductase subunit A
MFINLIIFLIVSFILSSIIMGGSYLLSRKNPEANKLEGFECGFNTYKNGLVTGNVSIRFYLVCILFLIFECESLFLLTWVFVEMNIHNKVVHIILFHFLILLYAGLVYEWKKGGLEWK